MNNIIIPSHPSGLKRFNYTIAYSDEGTYSGCALAPDEHTAKQLAIIECLECNGWTLDANNWGEHDTIDALLEDVEFDVIHEIKTLICPVCESVDLASDDDMLSLYGLTKYMFMAVSCQTCGHVHIQPQATPVTPSINNICSAAHDKLKHIATYTREDA